jgi:hypothetical protein
MLFHFTIPHYIDESVGGLPLNEADGDPDKYSVRQLLESRSELLMCLAVQFDPGLEFRSVNRRQCGLVQE